MAGNISRAVSRDKLEKASSGDKLEPVLEGRVQGNEQTLNGIDKFRAGIQSSFQSQLESLRRSQCELEQWIVQNCKELQERDPDKRVAMHPSSLEETSQKSILSGYYSSTPAGDNEKEACRVNSGDTNDWGQEQRVSRGWDALCSQKTPAISLGGDTNYSKQNHVDEELEEKARKKSDVHATYKKIEQFAVGSGFRKQLDKKLGKTFVTEMVDKWKECSILSEATIKTAQRISGTKVFSTTVTLFILVNAVFMAVDANSYIGRSFDRWQQQVSSATPVILPAAPVYLYYVDLAFAIFFTVEVGIRMIADQASFFLGEFKTWNALDIIVVVISWIEVIHATTASEESGNSTLPPLRLLRLLRMLRSLRVVRALRFFVDLRLVLLSLLHSLMPLLWCFATLFMIQFIFAIFFMQVVGGILDDIHSAADYNPSYDWAAGLLVRMGTFWDTMISLLSVITGGEDWTVIHKMFSEASLLVSWVWVFYIVVMTLGVLNVIAAVFVEGAITKAKSDRQLTLLDEREKDHELAKELIAEFKRIDTDSSDEITLEEWQVFCETEQGQDFLKVCNFGVGMTPESVFRILDLDESNKIVIQEFVTGLMAIHGAVHKIDVQTVINNNKKLIKKCYEYMEALSTGNSRIQDILVDGNIKLTNGLDSLQEVAHKSLEVMHRTSATLRTPGVTVEFNDHTVSSV